MKTTRITSSGNGGAGRWQRRKRALFAPSGIVLFMMIFLSAVDVGKTYGQQGVGISETPITPEVSSILELRSASKGFLVPRMLYANLGSIASPVQGLLVYATDKKSFYYYDNGLWRPLGFEGIGTANQLLGMNSVGNANEYKTLLGTANQIYVNLLTSGQITLSTPQDIHTGAAPTFNGLTISDAATQTNIFNNDINIGNSSTDIVDITGVTNINGGNLTLASPVTYITGPVLNISDGTTTNINSNVVNIGNAATDVIDITGITNLNGGSVTIASNLTLATGATVNNIRTDVRATGSTDNVSLVTETGIRTAINSSVTADNGLHENPDGNIRLGGNLIEATTITNNGNSLVIAGSNGNLTVAPTGNSSLTGTATLTTGTGQVTFAGNVNANNGVDITGADLTVATNATVGGTLGVTGLTTTNGIGNTGNITNSSDISTVTLSTSGLATLNSASVTTDATITGNTRVDGNFQFDAAGQPVNNIRTNVRATGLTDDVTLVTESGIRSAINSSVTADNGLHENPDGNIRLGGNLIEATTIVSNGNSLVIDGSNGDLTVAPTGNLDLNGTATLTTGTGQVTIGGNLNANSGADITGGALTIDNQAITQTTGGQVTFAGNVNANNGVDITGADLTVATNATVGGTLGVTGLTTTNGIGNTGNITNSSDISTVTLSTSGLATLNSASVTTDATITGNTRVDGNFQFDAAGQPVNNIRTNVRATGLTDDVTLVTESGIRSAINSSVTADNGLHENPDGNIRLGGNLIEATTIVSNGNSLVIDGSNGDLTVAPTGNLDLNGTATLTTGTGQVTIGGNLNANSGADITGGALTIDNQAITQTTGGQVTFAGNVNANNGVDITGADLTVATNATVGGTLGVTGLTTTNGIGNTGNITNSSDISTVTLSTSGLATLNSASVTTDATITGNTRVDGNFQFDAAGQPVNNIRTNVRATGLTDDVTLVTESGIRSAINSSVTADNGLHENPDGNIRLGGNLIEATTIVSNGNSLVIDGSNGDLTVAPTGNLDLNGTATLTTGTGQVTIGGNLNANSGADITGGALTIDNQAITQTTGGQVTFAGNVNANNGVDITGADLTVATNATVGGTLGATGLTTTNGIGNTGNITNSSDISTVTLSTSGLATLNSASVTTDATITGNTRVDGNFQFDAAGQPVNNIRTDVRATGLTDDVTLVTESGIRSAINSSVTADNGLHENPDGNIRLGGNLIEATTIVSNGNSLVIDGSNGDLTVAPTGNLDLNGTATLTTGTGQVTIGGNLNANSGADITGGALTIDNQAITQTTGGQVTFAGNVNANNGVDITGADLTVATNATVGGTLGVTGLTTTNGIGNTGNITNSSDISTVTLSTSGLATLNSASVTTDATITGNTRVDGNFQFDAAGQPVNNIRTNVRATGLTDDVTLVTESGIRSAINSSVTADNGLHENPDGNIRLGGNLIEATTIVSNGNSLVIDGSNGDLTVAPTGNLDLNGTATLTTGTGQVTIGGNLNANSGADITGGALTIDNQAITQTTGGQVTFAGNVNANNGVDITGADLTVATNATVGGTLGVTGLTTTNGIGNTGNITNSSDISTVTLSTSGLATLNSASVTTDATITGNTRVDGNFQFDAAGQPVNNIRTNVRATGLTDDVTLVTESGIRSAINSSVTADNGLHENPDGNIRLGGNLIEATTIVSNGNSLVIDGSNGDLTVAPTGNLDLNGTATLTTGTGQVTIGGNLNANSGADITGGALTIDNQAITQTTGGQVTFAGNVNANNGVDITGADLTVATNATVGGTLGVTGLTTTNGIGNTGNITNSSDISTVTLSTSGLATLNSASVTTDATITGNTRVDGNFQFDAAGQPVNNIRTNVRATGLTDDVTLVTESGIRSAINSSVTADNGLHENPDGNIRLGGNLIEATTIVSNGNSLVIDGSNGDLTVAPTGNLDLNGTATLTTGTGQVTIGGNLNANSGADITGGALTIDNQAITQTTGGQVTFAGNVNANNGVDITGADLTVATNATVGGTLGVTGLTTTNGIGNTGNITNSSDISTVTLSTSGLATLNSASVTTDATITGNTRVDGNFQFDAAGQPVNNIRTNVRATGLTDDVTLVTESGIRSAINSSVTADNGLHENPDGNIRLGGNLIEATTIVSNGNSLVIDGSNGDLTVAPTGNLDLNGTATLTTGTGQVTIGGNLNANSGADITGGALTIDNQAITQTTGGQVTFAGNVNANNGVDITGADLTVATNATVGGTLGATGLTTTNGIGNTGNITNSSDISTVTLSTSGLATLNSASVTTDATITGNTRVDGNFQFDAAGQPVNNIRTDVRATGLTDDVTLVTESGIRSAINSSVTADNGLHENPDGNIRLGGNLIEATTIVSNGNSLVIDGSNGDLTVAPTGNLDLNGTATLTTGTGQVTIGGNLNANSGADITGGALTIDNQAITQTTGGQVTFAGNVNANNGVDITGADLTVATNATVGGTLGVTGLTTTNGIGNTGNITNSSDISTVTLSTSGLATLNSASVTTDATITGNTRVDGNFQFDAAGQPVNNIRTNVRATGLTDDVTLVTESGIRSAINSSVTADNGLHENPDGNIRLGGNLIEATTIVSNGNSLVIDGSNGDLTVAPTGNLDLNGTATLTTGTGQVTIGGNLNANSGADITGGALTIDNQAITQTTGGQVTFAGNVNANNGVDITGADLTVATNATVGGTLGVTGLTTTNGIGNTGNITNSSDISTVTLSTSGLATLNSASVTTDATITGNTRVDGNFQFDAAGQPVNNIRTNVRATGLTDDVTLVTESGIRSAINSSVTADNGLHENPDGNIRLGGNLIEATTIVSNGNSLVIDGSNGDLTVAPTGNLDLNGTATLTTGTGQVTIGGNLNANSGADITGGALTIDNQAITQTTGGQVTFAGNVNANNGVDITGADLTVATNATVGGTLGATGLTTTNGIGNTGNITNSSDISTVTLSTSGLATLNSASVTTDATITGNTRVDGNFQFDAAGQPVNNIRTNVRATGLTDDVTLVTESGIRSAINSSVTADNGLHENPDGNIRLGGNLIEATTIVSNGNSLVIDGSNGDLTVAPTGNLDLNGTATLTTGTGQVTIGGNLNANSGADITGGALTIDNQAITQTTGGQVTFAGNVNANNGVDVTGNITVTGDATADQLTSTIADGTPPLIVTSTTPVANLSIGGNAATVTTNANLTGPIASIGNTTSITSQTGTGTTFVMSNSPALVTPDLGTPTALVGTNITGTAVGLTAGTVTTNANLTGEVTSVGNATTVTNAAVIGKVLTGFTSGAGVVAATDNILQALQKIDGNATAGANATHTGDATGATALTVVGINGTSMSGLGTGILKNTTGTGVPSIAIAADFPTLNQNTTGSAASFTGGLAGEVTGTQGSTVVGNAAVIGKLLTGYVSGSGTVAATDNILQAIQKLNGNDATNANLTGMVTSVGNATTVVTNADLSGEVTSSGNTTTVTNAAVIGKLLTGYTSGAGTVAATDNILQAIQKLNGNDATNANLTGEVTSVGNATTVTNAAVIGKVLTGFTSGAGVVAATDNILQAIQKIDGNATAGANATHTGDATGATALTVVGINGTSMSGLGTGILKNTTGTGVPSIAIAADFPTLNQNTTGSAASFTGGLAGEVTGTQGSTVVGNAAVIGKLLTGYVSGSGTVAATDNILQAIQKLNGNDATNANLTGMVTSVGNATTVVTNADLSGEVTSSGNTTTVTNAAVIGKLLTGYTSGAGTVAATDNILQAIQKLNGNDATNANLTGEVTSVGNATTVTNAAVIGKVLTGFTSGAGVVAATDNILQALQKIDGNATAGANATHTGEVTGSGILTITNAAVTYAKIQDIAALSVLGRSSNSTGVGAAISATATSNSVLRESGSTIGFGSINLASSGAVGTSILPVANGGTGAATLTGYLKGNGTSAMTASATIPGADISGDILGNAATATTASNLAGGAGGSIPYQTGVGATTLLANGSAGQVLTSAGTTLAPTWTIPTNGTVTNVSVVSANGLAGSVATAGTTPAITLSTTISGLLKGNGTAISAAIAGSDYVAPNGAIVAGTNTKITYDTKGLVTGGASAVLASADYVNQGTTTSVLHGGSAGNPSWGQIVNGDVDAAAGIVDTKLATISTAGKVANSATTATSSNTNSAIVARDGSGNFSAGTITATLSGNATNVSGTVAIPNGGTGQTTASAAFNALSPVTSLGDLIYGSAVNTSSRLAGNITATPNFLKQTGTGAVSAAPVWSTLGKADVGLSNVENTALTTWTGSANITTLGTIGSGTWNGTTIAVANGGTGATTAVNARTNLGLGNVENTALTTWTGSANITTLGTIGSGTWNGTTIAVANGGTGATTSVNARTNLGLGNVENTALSTWTGTTNITTLGTISSGTWNATTISITKGGTGQTTANAGFNALSPMSTLGDIIYGGASGTGTRLAGNITATGMFLKQTGNGAISAAPVWSTLGKADVGLSNVENTALTTWTGSANITTLGTIGSGTWNGTAIAVANGGTGAATKAAAFNALSPMTTQGDIIYGGAGGTGSRLADVAVGNALISGGVGAPPSWGKIDLATHTSASVTTDPANNYNVATGDFFIIKTNATAVTYNLPAAASFTGRIIIIKNYNAAGTITTNPAYVTTGGTTQTNINASTTRSLISDGTNWHAF